MRPIFLLLVFVLLFATIVIAEDALVESGRKVAKQELMKFPKHVGGGMGFETEADVANADIGAGLQVFTIDYRKTANVPGTPAFEDCVLPTSEWLFIVMNGQKPLSLFTMQFLGARWTGGRLGSEKFAKVIYKTLKTWPSSAGYHYRYFRVHGHIDFLEISQGSRVIGALEIIPPKLDLLASPSMRFNSSILVNRNKLWSELLSSIRQRTKR